MVLQSRRSRAVAYYGGSLVLGTPLAVAVVRLGATTDPVVTAGLAAVFVAAVHLAFLWYWRGLDEPARTAHKDALFWGGLLWLCLMMIGWFTLGLHPVAMPPSPWNRDDPAAFVAMGIGLSMIVYAVCTLSAWAIWWLRRR